MRNITILLFLILFNRITGAVIVGTPVLPLAAGQNKNLNLIVGFRGGMNFSQPLVLHPNEILQSPDGVVAYEKEYSPFYVNTGYQYAFMGMIYLKPSISLAFEPGISVYRYKYETLTGWTNGADASDYIEYTARHRNSLSYLEFPIVLRYDLKGNTLIPFVSLGIFYGFLLGGEKKLEASVTRYSATASIPYETSTTLMNNTGSYIRSRIGIAPGVGFYYPMGPVKLMFSVDLGLGLNNIVNESERYSNASATAGMYDIQDDMRLAVLNIHIGILFNTGTNQAGKAVECVTFKRKK
jgi:hypothetical protein